MKSFKQYPYILLFFFSTNLISCESLFPQFGLFHQSHTGNIISAGAGCSTTDYGSGSGGAYGGPYAEVGIGTYGESADIGWTEGLGGWMSYGASLSYAHIDKDASHFEKGNYFGVSGKGAILGLSLRLGIFHEPKLHNSRISIGIGVGL